MKSIKKVKWVLKVYLTFLMSLKKHMGTENLSRRLLSFCGGVNYYADIGSVLEKFPGFFFCRIWG
jgi:hypothetical protein